LAEQEHGIGFGKRRKKVFQLVENKKKKIVSTLCAIVWYKIKVKAASKTQGLSLKKLVYIYFYGVC